MNIEEKVFERRGIDYDLLVRYGFVREGNIYKYSKIFMDTFRADIEITMDQEVRGTVYDLTYGEEYVNFRMEQYTGSFVQMVREEYIHILEDIREHCTRKRLFITEQANRIAEKMIQIYHDVPEFLWDTSPGYGVFRNANSQKWYALIANIDRSKIDRNTSGEVEIINLKIDANKILTLLKRDGFYEAYHMNKKNWISIVLDDTVLDEEIIGYVEESYCYTEKKLRKTDLMTIPNVGEKTKESLLNIGITCVEELKGKDPEELYFLDCQVKGREEDKCQLYLFRMAVYYAEHDIWEEEKLKWWYWKDRKYPDGK